jgi:hypothetical protein
MTAIIKLIEYFYHLPSYADNALFQTDALKATALTTAFIAGVAWFAPPVSFKKKLG